MNKVNDFLDVNGTWRCTSCGACCSFIAPAVNIGFPKEWVMIDGACKWLDRQTKLCSIYETRPDVCKISKTLKPKLTDHEIATMCKVMKDYQDSK